jgi:hypothetical protein
MAQAESAERVRILLEVSVPIWSPGEGDEQADTPWSTAASLADWASGWRSDAEFRVLEPAEPEGEHYFATVLNADAESLWCWKHLEWERAGDSRD